MNHKTKIVTILIVLAIGLSACAGLPADVQNLSSDSAPSQEQAPDAAGQQPVQAQAPTQDGQAPQGQGQQQPLDGQGQGPQDQQAPGAQSQQQGQGQLGGHHQIDLASAAATLGVTEEELKAALGEPGQGPPDFAAVSAQLGVTEDALIEVLSVPAGGPQNDGQQAPQGQPADGQQAGDDGRHPQIDLASAAAQLGVTEEELMSALGEPGQGPPDLAAVAAELGVTEEALIEALGVPVGMQQGNAQP